MTREQAIEHGKSQLEVFGGEHREFIKLALQILQEETVSRESYEHEYFLRKELESRVAILEKQIAEQEDVLNKIRAEIEQNARPNEIGGRGNGKSIRYGLCKALEIISKYKTEQSSSETKIDCNNADCNNCVNHKYCDYESNNSEIPTGSTTKNNLAVDCIDRELLIEWLIEWDITPIIKNPLMRHLQGMPPVTPQNPIEKCTWIKYHYRTMRPKDHNGYTSYWRIPENRMDTLKYCPYCGKEIEVE